MEIFLAIALIVIFSLITYVAIKFQEISKEVDEESDKEGKE